MSFTNEDTRFRVIYFQEGSWITLQGRAFLGVVFAERDYGGTIGGTPFYGM